MKYSSFNSKEQTINVPAAIKGINNSLERCYISDQEAYFMKNIAIENGKLVTRKGLSATTENILNTSNVNYADGADFVMTDNVITVNGKTGKIGVLKIVYDTTLHTYRIFMVLDDGTFDTLGDINFNRLDDSTFYIPTNITFFTGKSSTGGGIFAFVSLMNLYDFSATVNRIYEVDSEYKTWGLISSKYIPTVYINGRGDLYEKAKAENLAYTGTPKNLETINMLTGAFYAYYSSDGYSSSFRLPYSLLADNTVTCRIYTAPDSYAEWSVISGSSESSAVSFLGSQVTLHIDRPTGVAQFKVDSTDKAIPIMEFYRQNNIRFLAFKDTASSFDDIVSCKISVSQGDKTFFTGGKKGAKIFVCDYENPLYFPECFNNDIGIPDSEVKAICTLEDELIAFKDGGIYSVRLKEGAYLNKIALLSDNSTYFKDMGSFTVKEISRGVSCHRKETLKILKNKPVWQGTDGRVYILKSGVPQMLSQKIESIILSLFPKDETFAVVDGNNYILMSGNKAVIINIGNEPYQLFWEFPEEVTLLGAENKGESTAFVLRYSNTNYFFTAVLSGEEDAIVDNKWQTVNSPIEYEIMTKGFLSEISGKKHINRVKLNIEHNEDMKLTVGDDGEAVEFKLRASKCSFENSKPIDVITDIFVKDSIGLRLSGKGGISLGTSNIYFTK